MAASKDTTNGADIGLVTNGGRSASRLSHVLKSLPLFELPDHSMRKILD